MAVLPLHISSPDVTPLGAVLYKEALLPGFSTRRPLVELVLFFVFILRGLPSTLTSKNNYWMVSLWVRHRLTLSFSPALREYLWSSWQITDDYSRPIAEELKSGVQALALGETNAFTTTPRTWEKPGQLRGGPLPTTSSRDAPCPTSSRDAPLPATSSRDAPLPACPGCPLSHPCPGAFWELHAARALFPEAH